MVWKKPILRKLNANLLGILCLYLCGLVSCASPKKEAPETCISDPKINGMQCCRENMSCYEKPYVHTDKFVCMSPPNFHSFVKILTRSKED